ncbi:uncharacterized protein LOC114516591 [Dendronephthya gigantea]|uniref:uncharacterized protein LOC114516591 n=1 Tax=Dendronephthya gigantea TaxID=151771 RepID=UPI00106B656C|nr:uncharacterized protein LOC114516591 [Dendronephthya gigantea]
MISETWLSNDVPDEAVHLPGLPQFNVLRNDKEYGRGGGVAFFIKDSIPTKVRYDLSSVDHECLWIVIRPKWLPRTMSKIALACVYLPPSLNSDEINKFYDYFCHCYDTLTSESPNIAIIVSGDFNPTGNGFQERIIRKQCQLKQLVKDPTRENATLDLVFTNIHQSYEKPTVLAPLGNPDHCMIELKSKDYIPKVIRSVLEYGMQIWSGGLTKMQRDNIERVQRRALNIISPEHTGYKDYSSKLIVSKLETLEERRNKACVLLIKDLIDPNHQLYELLPKQNAPAASRYISCEKYLCGKCLEIHNNWADFEDHVVLALEELAKPENRARAKGKPRCEKHDKILKFYCETCKVLVCRYCMDLNHTRPEHTWFPLKDVVVQHKEALNASSGIFEKQKNDAAESNRKIEEAMAILKNNATKARDTIKQQQQNILNAFTKKLEKETTALLDQVEMKYREANEHLLKQQANVKAYFEKAKSSLDFTSNILSSGSDEVLLALKHEIEEKAGSIENERPENMEPIHDNLFEYHPKPTKDIMENLKLNNLGKIVNPVQRSLSERSIILEQSICEATCRVDGRYEVWLATLLSSFT